MPHLDGLSALNLLMERFPRPMVMLSSLTAAGTEATIRALSLGAVDFLAKPAAYGSAGISTIGDELVAKVKRAVHARVRKPLAGAGTHHSPTEHATDQNRDPSRALAQRVARPMMSRPLPNGRGSDGHARSASLTPDKLLVIGASTGGPRALTELLSGLPADLPCAVLVVQHLPAGFTRSLAERLDRSCALPVAEAREGDILTTGHVLLAPGDFHLGLRGQRVTLDQGPRRHGVRPAVDTTLEAAAAGFGPAVLGVILTGMGVDGTEGARAVRAAGGTILAEHESTCVVYGMPRSVIEAGLAQDVAPLDHLPAVIARHLLTAAARPAGRR
jgi:two-component system chemotaxis response regulator CheB